jgi:prephenate dehydrogenase
VKVAVLGVGLIGGSIGLAASQRAGAHVVGYDPDAGVLSNAVELEAIDEPAFELAGAVADAEFVFVAAPVGATVDTARLALQETGAQCVVSDVGSTKQQLVEALRDPRFVGGHPLAGAETAGVENSRADLFDGATWYLTPGAETQAESVRRLSELLGALGADPVEIDARVHDRLMASVSHLPHVLANLLVAQAASVASDSLDAGGEHAGALSSGPSFRDATRVAGAGRAIWPDIYMSNRDALIEALDAAIAELGDVRETLSAGDAQRLADWHERAHTTREQLRRAGLLAGS